MGKSKIASEKKEKKSEVSGVKAGRVVKATETPKAKSKAAAKATGKAVEKEVKKSSKKSSPKAGKLNVRSSHSRRSSPAQAALIQNDDHNRGEAVN